MLSFLPGHLKAFINALVGGLNLLFWATLITFVGVLKALMPTQGMRLAMTRLSNLMMSYWVECNRLLLATTTGTRWQVDGLDQAELDQKGWYLVLANHLSWTDIVVVTIVLRNQVPMLKFFLKQQLFYVPMMGLACWALDMPFMRRYTKSQIAKNSKLKGKDIETTQRSCAKFKHLPTSVINFVEGSRLTLEKHQRQGSPFRYLMKPKAGGIAFALNALGEQFDQILDVTIVYPHAEGNIFAALLSDKLDTVHVHVRTLATSEVPHGSYDQDKAYRVEFQAWLNALWQEKDDRIHAMLAQHQPSAPLYLELGTSSHS